MGIVVRELFAEFGAKYQMRLLAGEKGLNRVMDWVHILEDVEAAKFLNGNELIFTTGIGKNMEHWLMCLIQGIYQRNACGMIVNIGPYIEEIPEEVIQFCEKKAFPVFSVPWKVHLVDMTRDFSTRVNEKEFEELNLTEAVRNAIFYSSQPNTYLPYMKRGGYSEKEKFQAAVFYLQADVRQFPDMRFRNRLIRSRIGNDQKKTVMFDQEGLVVLIFFGEDVEKSQEAMESLADFAASRNLEFSGGMGEIVTAAEEIVPLTDLFFEDFPELTEAEKEVMAGETVPTVLEAFKAKLEAMSDDEFVAENIFPQIKAVQKETGIKGKNLFMPIRIAVSGEMHGPELPDTIYLLGREKSIKHIDQVLATL